MLRKYISTTDCSHDHCCLVPTGDTAVNKLVLTSGSSWGAQVLVHHMEPHLADLHCFLDPCDLPMRFRHGKFDPLLIDGMIGLGHVVHESWGMVFLHWFLSSRPSELLPRQSPHPYGAPSLWCRSSCLSTLLHFWAILARDLIDYSCWATWWRKIPVIMTTVSSWNIFA